MEARTTSAGFSSRGGLLPTVDGNNGLTDGIICCHDEINLLFDGITGQIEEDEL
nr:hypothetical protein [Evansella caseinilytica]